MKLNILLFIAISLNSFSQNIQKLEENNGFRGIKLGSEISNYPSAIKEESKPNLFSMWINNTYYTFGNDLNYALIFTIFIGFFGTVIRYFLIPRISTLTFNSLIFLGIIFAYIWGYYLSNEKIDIIHIIGSILIIITIFMVNRK